MHGMLRLSFAAPLLAAACFVGATRPAAAQQVPDTAYRPPIEAAMLSAQLGGPFKAPMG